MNHVLLLGFMSFSLPPWAWVNTGKIAESNKGLTILAAFFALIAFRVSLILVNVCIISVRGVEGPMLAATSTKALIFNPAVIMSNRKRSSQRG